MKLLFSTILFFLSSVLGYSQSKISTDFYGKENIRAELCEQSKGFMSEQDVESLISTILSMQGLNNRFVVLACTSVENCIATIDKNNRPIILYNPNFLKSVKKLGFKEADLPTFSEQDWSTLTILSHEIGHHLNNHITNPLPGATAIQLELEADKTAGFLVYLMGGTLEKAKLAFQDVSENESYTHPKRQDRINALAGGYNDAEAKFPRIKPNPIKPNPINPAPPKNKYASISQLDMVEPFPLPSPAFLGNTALTSRPAEFSLTLLSKKSNDIIDGDKWFNVNSLKLPEYKSDFSNIDNFKMIGIPDGIPLSWKNLKLCKGIIGQNERIYLYGKDFSSTKILLITDVFSHEIHHFLDFSSFNYAPNTKPKNEELDGVFQSIEWASVIDNVLYVSHTHSTYASYSKGMNGYITAIDLSDNHILWTSKPLVNNAGNFEVVDNSIICGYGFSAEPDFLYVLDRSNGRQQSKISLDSGPDYIIRKDNVIYVRTYDKDYQFLLNSKK